MKAREFFRDEYSLDYLLHTFPKEGNLMAIMDGITMGGGVGISAGTSYFFFFSFFFFFFFNIHQSITKMRKRERVDEDKTI